MPLPLQPRSLLERVLQRDFSGVRMQVAGLEPLGVEAAARDNTVVVQRETAANLHRPEHLALLGHELTHVAAAGHAPVQRTPLTSPTAYTQGATPATPLVQRTLTPALPTTRGSVAAEERIADQVETGIRRMSDTRVLDTRVPDLQRSPLASNPPEATPTSPLNLPLSPLPKRARGTMTQRAPEVPSMLDVQRSPSSPTPTVTPAVIQRKAEGEISALAGLERTSMPVAQRYHVPVRRKGAEDEPAEESTSVQRSTPTAASQPSFGEKITITAPRVQRDGEQSPDADAVEEPDWEQLAEKILPLLKDRLMSERDRLGW